MNRASSNSNFRSRLGGGGEVETRRLFFRLLFEMGATAPGIDIDDAEVLIISFSVGDFPSQ